MSRFFVTGTGTDVGKTWVSRGIAAAATRRGLRVAALKPYETGCDPEATDALALARAAGRAELATADGFYRARPPLAPWAATLAGEPPPPPLSDLAAEIDARAASAALTLIEGAGGLLVPVDAEHDVADLAVLSNAPLLLVARNGLGVLSHTLTAMESAHRRGLRVAAVVLTPAPKDESTASNHHILDSRSSAKVVVFPPCTDNDDALADAAIGCGLVDLVVS